MIRTTTWNNIGLDITKAKTVKQALELANLNYTVEKVPVFLENGTKVPGAYVTKKEGTDTTFGVVGSRFEIVQNSEGFEFIDNLKVEGLKFVKAGETPKFTYIIASLPQSEILGDPFTPYVIFQNSHGGHSTLKATITPLRIVCQNQFNLSFKNSSNNISIRHTSSAQSKLKIAEEVMVQNSVYLDEFQKQASLLARKKVTQKGITSIIEQTFPMLDTYNPTQEAKQEEKRNLLLKAYNDEDNQNFKGTAWGLVNAFADYTTHRPLTKASDSARANHFIKTTLKKGIEPFIELVMNNV